MRFPIGIHLAKVGLVYIVTALAFSFSLPGAVTATGENTPRPNIVIIFCDDLGYADIGTFGPIGYQTPNLDRLASEGRVFRNFHVAQAVCSASRAALLTGCYPNRIGIHGALGPGSATGISPAETTLAEVVKPLGYATAIVGKWHLGDKPECLPVRHGFDEYFGLPYSNDMWPEHPDLIKLPLNDARRKRYPDLPLLDQDRVVVPRVTARDQDQLTKRYTQRAVQFIEKNKDGPFLLFLAHSMPHVPLHVSEQFRGKSGAGLYGDVIQEIDWSTGQVLETLRKHDLEQTTWVIFTSDNGPWLSYGEHAGSAYPLREGKGTIWQGGTRVPCIMRWPGTIPAASESKAMLMTIDLLPTLATLVGAMLPQHPIDGRNVWPLITGAKGARNPHSAYWLYYNVNQLQGVMSGDGRWKLVLPHTYRTLARRPGGVGGQPVQYEHREVQSPQLYDLQKDLSESTDVASRHPQTVRKLLEEVERARIELGDGAQSTGKGTRAPFRAGRQNNP